MTRAIIWSKDYCPYCVNAKALLDSKGIVYEERNISQGEWTKEQLLEAVPDARTVPQVFMDGKLIGGYDKIQQHLLQKD